MLNKEKDEAMLQARPGLSLRPGSNTLVLAFVYRAESEHLEHGTDSEDDMEDDRVQLPCLLM